MVGVGILAMEETGAEEEADGIVMVDMEVEVVVMEMEEIIIMMVDLALVVVVLEIPLIILDLMLQVAVMEDLEFA